MATGMVGPHSRHWQVTLVEVQTRDGPHLCRLLASSKCVLFTDGGEDSPQPSPAPGIPQPLPLPLRRVGCGKYV
jgi:hypothetical protein